MAVRLSSKPRRIKSLDRPVFANRFSCIPAMRMDRVSDACDRVIRVLSPGAFWEFGSVSNHVGELN
jgi:hypothetical protein